MENIRVRYSWTEREVKEVNKDTNQVEVKVQKQPKNTMCTLRDNDTIYFGIARCHFPLDTMDKNHGKALAQLRINCAIAAKDVERPNSWRVDGTLKVNSGGMFGQVNVTEITKLLQYFENLDETMLKCIHSNKV